MEYVSFAVEAAIALATTMYAVSVWEGIIRDMKRG